jgi:DNA-binding response OmpR family regulator
MDDAFHPGIRGSALVLVEDQRAALASVLLLQEMGFSVDVSAQPEAALSWVRLARYEWVVCSGSDHVSTIDFLLRLRYAAPGARILLIGGTATSVDGLDALGIEVLRPPVDVNMLVDRFAQEAA